MTASKFMWAVVAGRGYSSEQLGRSFTEDLDDAKAKVNEHAERLRREGPDRLVRPRLGLGSADHHRAARQHSTDARVGARVLRRRAGLTRPWPNSDRLRGGSDPSGGASGNGEGRKGTLGRLSKDAFHKCPEVLLLRFSWSDMPLRHMRPVLQHRLRCCPPRAVDQVVRGCSRIR